MRRHLGVPTMTSCVQLASHLPSCGPITCTPSAAFCPARSPSLLLVGLVPPEHQPAGTKPTC